MKIDALVADFATRDPGRFATLLAQGSFADLLDILHGLTAPTAVAVATRLPANALKRLALEEMDQLSDWLSSAKFDDSVLLIGRLPRQEAASLVNGIGDEGLRRRLRKFMNFPEHCVGAIAASVELQVSADLPVAEVLAELRRTSSGEEVPAVVLDESGRLLGKLDVWKLLLAETPIGAARDFIAPVPMLFPEVSIAAARELPYWREHRWLAVVDRDRRLLGAASRAAVLMGGEVQSGSNLLLDGFTDLCRNFYRVSADLLSSFMASRSWR